jgi:hypothetical protein
LLNLSSESNLTSTSCKEGFVADTFDRLGGVVSNTRAATDDRSVATRSVALLRSVTVER